MTHKVFLREPARQLLAALVADDRPRAKELARILLSLGKNPRPRGSRDLAPSKGAPVPGGRIWDRPDWILIYRVDDQAKTVDVSRIERRP